MDSVLEDFRLKTIVSQKIKDKYKKDVPKEIIDIWNNYGLGTFMQGYLKSVNPEEYEDLLQDTSQRYKDAKVLFSTSMGDLVIWADDYVRLLNYRYGILKTVMPNFLFFFKSLESDKFKNKYLNWQPYPEAIERYGEPEYDECFGYTPLLGLGGSEKVENLKKVKLREHILIITEFMGPIR